MGNSHQSNQDLLAEIETLLSRLKDAENTISTLKKERGEKSISSRVENLTKLKVDKPTEAKWVGTSTDFDEHKKREEKLDLLNRTLKGLSKSNQAILYAVNESDFLKEICRIIVEDCGYMMVWIGYAEDDEFKSVRPVAYSGFENGYLEALEMSWADTVLGHDRTGNAIRTGLHSVCKNILIDEQYKSWRSDAVKRGYASLIVFPMIDAGKTIGAMTIYSKEPNPFTNIEVEFLTELAHDLTIGVISFRLRSAKAELDAALIQSRESYSLLFDQMKEGFAIYEVIFDKERVPSDIRYLEINPAFEKITGLSHELVTGKLASEIFPREDPEWLKLFGDVELNGKPAHFEKYSTEFNKQLEYLVYNYAPGKCAMMFVDMTERKNAEDALNETRRLLRAVTNGSPDPIYVKDIQGRMLLANPATLALFDKPAEQVMGRNDLELLDNKETGRIIMANDRLAIESGKTVMMEERIMTASGERVFLSAKTPYINTDGEISGVIGISRDISDRKAIEDILKESEEKYRQLVDGSPNIIYSLSNKRGGLYFSKYAEKILGYAPEYLAENTLLWYNSIHPDDLPNVDLVLADVSSKSPSDLEYRIKDIYNNWHWLFDKLIRSVETPEETIVERIAVDITGMKKIEQQLRDGNASKDKFFSVLAHDLRSPFTGFIGLTQLLNQEADSISPNDLKEMTQLINESANSIYTLLTDLLLWAKTQMGNVTFHPESIDLNDLVFEAIYRSQNDALKKNIAIISTVKPGLNALCDRNMISSVIRNLLNNAVKFTRASGEINISIDSRKDDYLFAIKDNGVGISQDRIDKLFLIGDTFSTPGTANEKGTGLGLILCKEFVEKNGGKIQVESQVGLGTSFSFSLPKEMPMKIEEQNIG